MKQNLMKRALSLLLCAALLLGNIPAVVFAVEDDGLCEHHTTHLDCGYEEGLTCGFVCAECAAAEGGCRVGEIIRLRLKYRINKMICKVILSKAEVFLACQVNIKVLYYI